MCMPVAVWLRRRGTAHRPPITVRLWRLIFTVKPSTGLNFKIYAVQLADNHSARCLPLQKLQRSDGESDRGARATYGVVFPTPRGAARSRWQAGPCPGVRRGAAASPCLVLRASDAFPLSAAGPHVRAAATLRELLLLAGPRRRGGCAACLDLEGDWIGIGWTGSATWRLFRCCPPFWSYVERRVGHGDLFMMRSAS